MYLQCSRFSYTPEPNMSRTIRMKSGMEWNGKIAFWISSKMDEIHNGREAFYSNPERHQVSSETNLCFLHFHLWTFEDWWSATSMPMSEGNLRQKLTFDWSCETILLYNHYIYDPLFGTACCFYTKYSWFYLFHLTAITLHCKLAIMSYNVWPLN